MAKSKKGAKEGDRLVWQEFGTGNSAATQRPVQELPPQQQQIRVQATRKGRGGKTVTVITGFQLAPESLTTLMKQLKSKCGAGGTVREGNIEIQGDHTQTLCQQLLALGYPTKISGG